jgi:uncharacterized protein
MVLTQGRRLIITPKKKVEMRFAKRRSSLNIVIIKSIDRDRVREAVYSYADELRKKHPKISRIIWFGSWVRGFPSPGSDVDLCLILFSSKKNRRDRISDYLPLGFPVGIDLFVYTEDEFDHLKQNSSA